MVGYCARGGKVDCEGRRRDAGCGMGRRGYEQLFVQILVDRRVVVGEGGSWLARCLRQRGGSLTIEPDLKLLRSADCVLRIHCGRTGHAFEWLRVDS